MAAAKLARAIVAIVEDLNCISKEIGLLERTLGIVRVKNDCRFRLAFIQSTHLTAEIWLISSQEGQSNCDSAQIVRYAGR